MTTLLDLPIELRLAILDLVIFDERVPPSEYSEEEKSARVQMTSNRETYGWFFGERVYCEADLQPYRPRDCALSAVCRQLRQEVGKCLEDKPVTYKLDLLVPLGRMLWPTWTSLPTYRSTVDIIEVKFRASGPGTPCARLLRGGDAGPAIWVWWFYSVLEHFFTVGLAPEPHSNDVTTSSERRSLKPRKQMMAARVLDLDFVAPNFSIEVEDMVNYLAKQATLDEDTPGFECIHCKRPCHTYRAVEGLGAFTSKMLYRDITYEVLSLLGENLSRWGDILHKGIETIRFRLEGELQYELDLLSYLTALHSVRSAKETPDWVKEVYRTRKEFGLCMTAQESHENHQAAMFREKVLTAALECLGENAW